jgi:hypothetical protein
MVSLLAATPVSAQRGAARLEEIGSGIGRALLERYRGVPGEWTVESLAGCERPERDRACSLRDPLPAANVGRVISTLAAALAASTATDAVARTMPTRKRNLDRARAAGAAPACGDPRVDGPLAKIVRVSQVRVAGDTVEARVSVLQLGRLAGCPAGMHVLHATIVQAAGAVRRIELDPAGHYEVAIEVPRRHQ